MKKIQLLLLIFFSCSIFAQVPQGISYQAIALNSIGVPIANSNVGVRLSILDNTATGAISYSETQTKLTNTQGLFNLVIGQGNSAVGSFSAINWGTNPKFLKVELDVAGGTSYILVGTTQLLAVPYALLSKTVKTTPGEGITLTSPNGTPFLVSVNDSGQLSLPTSSSTSSLPNAFYMYGSFNSFNPATAILMTNSFGSCLRRGVYKYFTAETEIKFSTSTNASSPVYGTNLTQKLVLNGASYMIPTNGFYNLSLYVETYGPDINTVSLTANTFVPKVYFYGVSPEVAPTYNVGTNKFSFVINGVTTTVKNSFVFTLSTPCSNSVLFGDDLYDLTIDQGGQNIVFPNLTTTPKNFRVELTINASGSGNYTITQIP